MLDEAYAEYVRDPAVPDGLRLYREHPNVAVLRTFSKAYGLAGLGSASWWRSRRWPGRCARPCCRSP